MALLSGKALLRAGKYVQNFKDSLPDGIDMDGVMGRAGELARTGMLDNEGGDFSARLKSALTETPESPLPEPPLTRLGVKTPGS